MLTEVAAPGLKQPVKACALNGEVNFPLEQRQAFATEGFVIQSQETLPNGVKVLISTCVDYDDFKRLPNVVAYECYLYGKTGWNSDRHIAYYRDDAKIALAQ